MKTGLFTRLAGTVLTGLLVLTGAGIPGLGPAARADGGPRPEGSWLNAVKIVTCPPAPHAVLATFQSMTSFVRGGVVIEGGSPAGPPPGVSRSAGHGLWERTGQRSFRVRFRFHGFDNLGRLVRITEVRTQPSLIDGDNPETPDVIEPYYLRGDDGTNTITNINPVDGTVISVTQGCNQATSRPLLFED
jgi:hypothetical protein